MSGNITICFTDTETTGLDQREDSIIQIAMIKVEHNPKNPLELRELASFESKLVLPEGAVVPAEVAAINGYTEELWAKEALPRKEVMKEYLNHLRWSAFGGQNPAFDHRFIDQELYNLGLSWPKMSHYRLWAVEMLAVPLDILGFIDNIKQETLMKFFQLGDQKHDALDDIRNSVKIYRRLLWIHYRGLSESAIAEAIALRDD